MKPFLGVAKAKGRGLSIHYYFEEILESNQLLLYLKEQDAGEKINLS